MNKHEKLSAFLDDELDDAQLDALLAELDRDETLNSELHDFQLIHDAMNQRPLLSPDFMSRFSERLADEPVVIAPARLREARRPAKRQLIAASMAASFVLVGAVAWWSMGSGRMSAEVPPAAEVARAASVQDDPAMGYMAAHRVVAGLPMPVGQAVILSSEESERLKPVPVAKPVSQ
ncbi:sigma-E factor negative regulatory protein [Burkholderiaceae bacterium DAT-1]|nr:sigma-E factor negative regulatory protein [Burkholderiaceae bacterium DAT-1]